MPDSGGEKTEKASPKKREDERKKGNVFTSKDIVTVISLVISFYAFSFVAGQFIDQLEVLYAHQMLRITEFDTLPSEEVGAMLLETLYAFATTLLPAMLIIALASVVATVAQTRLNFSTEQIKFKMERIDPIKGFKRLFSLRSLVELVKSIIKITLITWLLYTNIRDDVALLSGMIDWELPQAISFIGDEILSLVLSVTIAFGIVAVIDFLYQRWEYEKGIRMSKQEVKDEYKQMEGSPEIKSARRQKQREYAQKRMMQQVQDADVIVRNPTHYAVALKYVIDVDPAPIVLAKGADNIALRIVEEGAKYGIATVENKPLARSLYETADLYDYIPAELFQPVAEVLAWLYAGREKNSSGKDN